MSQTSKGMVEISGYEIFTQNILTLHQTQTFVLEWLSRSIIGQIFICKYFVSLIIVPNSIKSVPIYNIQCSSVNLSHLEQILRGNGPLETQFGLINKLILSTF